MTDAEKTEAGITILHYGMLAMVAVNLIINALVLFAVRSNQKISITAEAFARIAAEDRVSASDLDKLLTIRDEQIEELRKKIEAMEGTP